MRTEGWLPEKEWKLAWKGRVQFLHSQSNKCPIYQVKTKKTKTQNVELQIISKINCLKFLSLLYLSFSWNDLLHDEQYKIHDNQREKMTYELANQYLNKQKLTAQQNSLKGILWSCSTTKYPRAKLFCGQLCFRNQHITALSWRAAIPIYVLRSLEK